MAFFRINNQGLGHVANTTNRTLTTELQGSNTSHPYILSNAGSHAVNYTVTATTGGAAMTVRIGKINYVDNHTTGGITWLTDTSAAQSGGTTVSQSVNFTVDSGDTDVVILATGGSASDNAMFAIHNVNARHGTSASSNSRLYISSGPDTTGWTAGT